MTDGLIYDFRDRDESLLSRCADGDESALNELFKKHERPVYGTLHRILGNHEDAEEALADVFVKVWRAAGRFRGDSKFTTWLYRIVANTAKDRLRSRKSRPEIVMDDSIIADTDVAGAAIVDPEEAALAADELARINRAMQTLSAEDRTLITLYHLKDFSLEDIAEITKRNRNTLKVRLFRARKKLRIVLEEMDRKEADNELRASTGDAVGIQPETAESQ